MKINNIEGKKFGRLLVIELHSISRNGRQSKVKWICKCDCGNDVVCTGDNLRGSHTKSCGCFKSQSSAGRAYKHGMHGSHTWLSWREARYRVSNPNHPKWHRYGGRGISMCERWFNSFEEFFKDMWTCPPDKTIDRINNDGDYEPGNCRWATPSEQANNTSTNGIVKSNGTEMTISQYCKLHGLCPSKFRYRHVVRGLPIEIATKQTLEVMKRLAAERRSNP